MRKKYSARQSVHNFGSTIATALSVKERGRPRPRHNKGAWAGRPRHNENKWAGRPPSFAKPTQVGGSPTLL